jgi:hypothetical protein
MSFFEKLLHWSKPREFKKRVVHLGDFGFEIEHEGVRTVRVEWASVAEITAFKKDLFSIDEVCLGFRREGRDTFSWAGEQDVGFDALQKEIERRFPGIPPDWFGQVMTPAFEEKWTTIWRKESTH